MNPRLKSRWLFVLALIVAWSIIIAKIITPPIPYMMIFLFSVPISLFHLPGYLLWDRFKERQWSFLLFPCVITIMEWIQYTFTPFANWGVAAYTQSHTISLMQSVFGMAGPSFLIYWVNVSITGNRGEAKDITTHISDSTGFSVVLYSIWHASIRYKQINEKKICYGCSRWHRLESGRNTSSVRRREQHS